MFIKSVSATLTAFFIGVGCIAVYQRETSIINNQNAIASEITQLRKERDDVNKQLEAYLNGINSRLIDLESLNKVRVIPAKK